MKHSAEFENSPLPIVGLDDEYSHGFVDPFHAHTRSQLLYASRGIMTVVTRSASYVIPCQRAIWIPAGVEHEVSCRSAVSLRTLYFAKTSDEPFRQCQVIEISELLRCLIIEAVMLGTDYEFTERNTKLLSLMAAELRAMPSAPYHVRMPADPRLLRICQALIDDPADKRDLDDFAKLANMSRRSLTRAFAAETGMTVAVWRQQARIMAALSLLAQGKPITVIAFEVGYDSSSAFTTMFHKVLGASPSHYRMQ